MGSIPIGAYVTYFFFCCVFWFSFHEQNFVFVFDSTNSLFSFSHKGFLLFPPRICFDRALFSQVFLPSLFSFVCSFLLSLFLFSFFPLLVTASLSPSLFPQCFFSFPFPPFSFIHFFPKELQSVSFSEMAP